jgi:nicotinamidase-related amidase
MERLLRIEKEEIVLVVIDIQEALMKAMDPEIGKNLPRNLQVLITFARELGVPILATEQYPKGLGRTIPDVKKELGDLSLIEKVAFSCCRVDAFNERLNSLGRRQIVLSGIETHVCVLQTAADLIQRGYGVHVVADAVCSRRRLDWEIGLRWMEKNGAMITTTEIIAFQLLKEAGTDEFKRLSKFVK